MEITLSDQLAISNTLYEVQTLRSEKEHLIALLRRLEQEMRYAGWDEKQLDNYQRAELYAEVCKFLGDK